MTVDLKRRRVVADPEGPGESMTKQSFSEGSDINVIARKYVQTGELPIGQAGPAVFGDFTGPQDYLEQFMRIEAAHEAFMELPAEVRDAVDNDPAKLIELAYAGTPEAKAKLQELGLIPKPEQGAPAGAAEETPAEG